MPQIGYLNTVTFHHCQTVELLYSNCWMNLDPKYETDSLKNTDVGHVQWLFIQFP